jgi:GNAT superfamily N-acetyltransferase
MSNTEIEFLRLYGSQARPFAEALAQLRITIFRDYPYLYDGNFEYEKNYLETYFNSHHSFILLLKDKIKDKYIGATTAIWAQDESEEFRIPFSNIGLNPKEICYFGESLLLPEYRGIGLGKIFFKERIQFASSMDFIKYLSFCAVIRPDSHPLRPEDYRPLDTFWNSMGFKKVDLLTTNYSWKDINNNDETSKTMQYWLKSIEKGEEVKL